MKNKKMIAFILAFALIICNALSVSATGIVGEMITDISGMNRLTVSAALTDYFNSREAFLLNQADSINVPLSGVVEDEAAHREKYASEGIIFVDSAISVGEISVYERNADAEVTETVTYLKDGVTNTAVVTHTLFLGLNDNNVPVVISDRYFESFSNFKSCSYVDESATVDMNAVGGSGNCIVYVAEQEKGYVEGTNNDNKYGAWYGENNLGWCAAFIAWCANEANISDSVIKCDDYPPAIMAQFKTQGKYYSRSAAVGSYSPNTGDIVFFTEDNTSASHIGIVRSSDASNIYVVHGNYSDCVCFTTFSRTDTYILGYGKPAYESSSHTYKSIHDYDSSKHWLTCVNCSYTDTKTAHTLTYATLSNMHKANCECGYFGSWESHYSATYLESDTEHWKCCDTCGRDFDREDHTFDEVLFGRVYVCVDCGYETDSPNDVGIDVEEN